MDASPLIAALLLSFWQDSSNGAPPAPEFRRVGEKMSVGVESSVDLEIVTRDVEGDSAPRLVGLIRKERFIQEVLEVSQGRARKLKVRCVASSLQRSASSEGPRAPEASALKDRAFIVHREAGKAVVTAEDGGATGPEAGTLGSWEDVVELLPAPSLHEIGQSWKVSGQGLLSMMLSTLVTQPEGDFTGTLSALQENQGSVSLSGAFTAKSPRNESARIELKGELVFGRAPLRPLSLALSGNLELAKEVLHRTRRPGQSEEEVQKVGEIRALSRKLDLRIDFGPAE
jgi:hypothetical protein